VPTQPLLVLVIRGLAWSDHPAAPDLELLLTRPPGVVAVSPSAGSWVCIVLDDCPTDVRAVAERLAAGPLPSAVTLIQAP
jgi:hypothetical protein